MTKIMAVEDGADILALIEKILKRAGYEFVGCTTGEEALEKFGKEKPDIVLLDIMLPGVDGYDVYKKMKSIHKDQKIAFLSALDISAKAQVRLFSLGSPTYISKPFTPDELLGKVRSLLEK
ncbi:MAG: response regulator transcription factor [Candidatus Hadarchaeota archaeon]